MAGRTEREVLEHLVEVCRDGERGFRAAAQYVHTSGLQELFAELAEQRQTFVRDLEPHLNRLAGSTRSTGTRVGAVHRRWMNVKAHMPGHKDETIVAEAERGEHAAIKAYNDALNGVLPPTAIGIVEAQVGQMRFTQQRIRELDQTP